MNPAVPARVWTATGWLVAGRLGATACGALSLFLLARGLPVATFGLITFWLGIFLLVDGWTDFGSSAVAVRESARERWALVPMLRATRRLRGVMALVAWFVLTAFSFARGETDAGWISLAALYPLSRTLEASAIVYQVEIAWRVPVALRFATAVARLAGFALLLYGDVERVAAYLGWHALVQTAGNTALWFAARARLPLSAMPVATPGSLAGVRFWRAALPLGLAGVCQQAYFWVDNLFLRGLRSHEELGLYNACVRLLTFAVLVATLATTAALPWLAQHERRGELGASVDRLAWPPFVLACVGVGLVYPHSGELLALVFGEPYRAAAPTLRWLWFAVLVIYVGAGLLTALVAAGRTKEVLFSTGTALLVNLVANACLVPSYGMEGAAIATVATEGVLTLLVYVLLRRAGDRPLARPMRFVGALVLGVLLGVASSIL